MEQITGLTMCLPDANDASTISISIIYAVLGVRCPLITVNHRPCTSRSRTTRQIEDVASRGGPRAGQTPCYQTDINSNGRWSAWGMIRWWIEMEVLEDCRFMGWQVVMPRRVSISEL